MASQWTQTPSPCGRTQSVDGVALEGFVIRMPGAPGLVAGSKDGWP